MTNISGFIRREIMKAENMIADVVYVNCIRGDYDVFDN